jgi:hypothetical protein
MRKPKMISIQLSSARKLARLLDRLQEATCKGCTGGSHETDCPAAEAFQMRNYLTQRINNPNRDFHV